MDEETKSLCVQIIGFIWMFFMTSPAWGLMLMVILADILPAPKVEPTVKPKLTLIRSSK